MLIAYCLFKKKKSIFSLWEREKQSAIALYERRVFSSIAAFRLGLYISKCILINRINEHNISLGITWKSSSICCKTSSRIHECRMWIRMKKKEAVRVYIYYETIRETRKENGGNYFFIKIKKMFLPQNRNCFSLIFTK